MRLIPLVALVSLLALTACGDTRIERAGNGAVIGTVTGAAVGALCCADPIHGAGVGAITGAVIGGAVGAILPGPIFFNDHTDNQ